MLARSYGCFEPTASKLYVTFGSLSCTQPTSAPSCEVANTSPLVGSTATPPQLTPPVPPGNWIVDFGGASGALYMNGVNGPAL